MATDDDYGLRGIVDRIADATGCYLYAGRLHADDRWELLFRGPGLERLVGGPVPPDAGDEAFVDAVHPDDRERWREGSRYELLRENGRAEVELRLVGQDGVTRWVRDIYVAREQPDGSLLVDGVTIDITRERRAAEEAEEAYAMLRAAAEAVDAYLYVGEIGLDGRYRTIFQGPGLHRLLGLPADQRGRIDVAAFEARVHPDDLTAFRVGVARRLAARDCETEYRLRGHDGVTRWIVDRARTRRLADGRVRVEGLLYDVTERMRMVEALEVARREAEQRSRTDSLTGAFNRRHVTEAIHAELRRAQREGGAPAVLLLDLDSFKRVNDTYGHQAGDAVLCEVVRRLQAAVRPYDVVGRWGGEELVVLTPGVHDDAALRSIAEGLRDAIGCRPVVVDAETLLRVTVSVGAARAADDLWSVDALVHAADRALYAAKRRGRDQAVLITDLTVEDLVAEEPEAMRLARALALQAALREGLPESHAEQVAELAAATAARLGLSPRMVERCRLGGWLHDVGKTSLPDRILLRAEPLDAAEWAELREHAVRGESVVRQVAGLGEAAPAVRHHHERWDGRGYPDGLAGEDIPIEARVVAACDAFASMTTERPYRVALGTEEAREELRRGAGTQFDPAVVEALLGVLADGAVADPACPLLAGD